MAANRLEERIRRLQAELEVARVSGELNQLGLLAAQHRLAHAYRAARRFDEAIRWFIETVEGSVETFGENHVETLRYRSSLANCHYAAGHTDLAIGMFRELYEARLTALGEEHPDTMRSRGAWPTPWSPLGVMAKPRGCTDGTLGIGRIHWVPSIRPRRRAGGIWSGRRREVIYIDKSSRDGSAAG